MIKGKSLSAAAMRPVLEAKAAGPMPAAILPRRTCKRLYKLVHAMASDAESRRRMDPLNEKFHEGRADAYRNCLAIIKSTLPVDEEGEYELL